MPKAATAATKPPEATPATERVPIVGDFVHVIVEGTELSGPRGIEYQESGLKRVRFTQRAIVRAVYDPRDPRTSVKVDVEVTNNFVNCPPWNGNRDTKVAEGAICIFDEDGQPLPPKFVPSIGDAVGRFSRTMERYTDVDGRESTRAAFLPIPAVVTNFFDHGFGKGVLIDIETSEWDAGGWRNFGTDDRCWTWTPIEPEGDAQAEDPDAMPAERPDDIPDRVDSLFGALQT